VANKQAFRKLKRRSDGVMGVVFIDGKTGEELSDLTGYDIIDQGVNFGDLLDQDSEEETEEEDLTKTIEQLINGRDNEGMDLTIDPTQFGPENNFGYIDKPKALSLLGILPGMLGLAGKAVNAMINTNNVAAVNRARAHYGLPALTTGQSIKGVMKDNQGYVGDVVIGDETFAISFEGETPDGRPALTPVEVDQKMEATGRGARPATVEEVEAAKADHATDGKTGFLDRMGITSPLSSLKDAVKSVASTLSGVSSPTPQSPATPSAPEPAIANVLDGNGIASVDPDWSPEGTAPAAPERVSKPGGGLANLVDRGKAKTDLEGKGRNVAPDPKLMDVVQQATEQALGPGYTAVVGSGTYTPEVIAAINQARAEGAAKGLKGKALNEYAKKAGQIGTTRHTTGKAGDFYFTDPSGNTVTDPVALDKIANMMAQLGITGLGLGRPGGYMSGTSIHADTVDKSNPTAWGGKGQAHLSTMKDAVGFPDSFTGNIPVPTGKPGPVEAKETAEKATEEIGKQVEQAFGIAGGGSLGKVSKEDVQKIAFTIAGELGSKTLQAIASGNPAAMQQARQEIAAITGTVVNRAKSSRFTGLSDPLAAVLDPSQYNSLLASNQKTTSANFNQFGGFISDAVSDYFSGENPSPAPNATHYWNPDVVNPSWASAAKEGSIAKVGEHTFADVAIPGTNRSEYSPGLPTTAPTPESRPTATPQVAPNQTLAPRGMPGTPLAPAPVEPVSRQALGPATAMGIANIPGVTMVSPEQAAKLGLADPLSGKPTTSPNNFSGLVAPGVSMPAGSVTTQSFNPTTAGMVGTIGGPSGMLGTNQGFGQDSVVGYAGYTPTTLGGTGIGSAYSAGSLAGTAAGYMGSPYGTASTHSTGSLGFDFGAPLGNWSSGGSDAGGFGSAGSFGNAPGGGSGSQGNAGLSSAGYGGYSDAGSAEASFGGFNAGSLGGSASGFGSGYGSAGSDAGAAGGFSGSAGSWGGAGTASVSTGPSPSSPAGGAQAAAGYSPSYTAASFGLGDSVGGVGAGDGGTVLCTYFHYRGMIPTNIYKADYRYGLKHTDKYTFKGYHYWAKPLVQHLKKHQGSKREKIAFFVTNGWAREMASRMGVGKGNLTGKILITLVEPICYLIGRIVFKATQRKELTPKGEYN
jgi:hypothetical protein